jgi:hypothetical protein
MINDGAKGHWHRQNYIALIMPYMIEIQADYYLFPSRHHVFQRLTVSEA